MPSGEGIHSSKIKLTGMWCWVFLPSTNSVQSGPLKLALLTDYALEDHVSSHPLGFGIRSPSPGTSRLSDTFASELYFFFLPLISDLILFFFAPDRFI